MRRSDIEHVRDAQQHLRKLREHLTRGDLADETIFDAVCMRLSAAIEGVLERLTRALGAAADDGGPPG